MLDELRGCRVCAAYLPLGPRPVARISPTARILVVGQAPGTKVHASGLPFDDPSGDRLRSWMGVDRETFYDASRIAFMPAGLCYPGRDPKGGDRPPRRECAPLWHPRLRPLLTEVRLTVLVGMYAHAIYLGDRRRRTLTETVERWRDYLPDIIAAPHPSWRVNMWLKKHPWFEADTVPELRRRVAELI
ncbi:MAG: uracil-DNA glycosylase family protein [Alphaproteobacteria bacterium]